jgi:hypothetical protein
MMEKIISEMARDMVEEWAESGANKKAFLDAMDIGPEELWKLFPKKPETFDIAEIRDETHLREVIMDKVLKVAARVFTVSANGGKSIAIEKLPEDQQEERLNKIMLEILDTVDGPGQVLRQGVATAILNYRMLIRLKELQPTLPPPTVKYKRLEEGITYIKKEIRVAMFYFEAWPFFSDSSLMEKFGVMTRELFERFLIPNSNQTSNQADVFSARE